MGERHLYFTFTNNKKGRGGVSRRYDLPISRSGGGKERKRDFVILLDLLYMERVGKKKEENWRTHLGIGGGKKR